MRIVIKGGTIVTCDAADRVLAGDVILDGDRIEALGFDVTSRRTEKGLVRVLDARGCAVIPGFVQAHVHLCQALFRGMADDLELLDWLKTRIWPLDAPQPTRRLPNCLPVPWRPCWRTSPSSPRS